MNRYRRIIEYVSSHPWAIQREALDGMVELLRLRVEGGRLGEEEIMARLAAAREKQGERKAAAGALVGVIPMYGTIMPRANLMTEMSGGTTIEGLQQSFRAALADDEIGRIVFDIDSPGGSVEGVPELGEEIRAARGRKPMTAVANYMAGSAAYWLGAQADEFVASPSALVGSVGVYGVHEDWSAANEMMGVKPTYITFGKNKAEGNPDAPLSDDTLAHIQSLVDATGHQFVAAVAAGRGVPQKSVMADYGEGRAFHPTVALEKGMIDRIATFDEVMASKPPRMRARRQEAALGDGLIRVEANVNGTSSSTFLELPDGTEVASGGDAQAEHVDLFEFEREKRRRQTA
jgi:signal peptide peptidase SppA